jgi:hypothetical protein
VKAPSTTVAVVLGSLLLVPSSAAAQRCSGEGLAAIDQYCETVPGVTGKQTLVGSVSRLGAALSPAVRQRLARAGPEGRALLALPVGASLGPAGTPRALPGARDAIEGTLGEEAVSPPGVARAVGGLLSGDSALSGAFRWALLLSTVGLSGTAWVLHRRRPPSHRAAALGAGP